MAGIKGMKWEKLEKLEMDIAQDIQKLSKMAGPGGEAIADRIFKNFEAIHMEYASRWATLYGQSKRTTEEK